MTANNPKTLAKLIKDTLTIRKKYIILKIMAYRPLRENSKIKKLLNRVNKFNRREIKYLKRPIPLD